MTSEERDHDAVLPVSAAQTEEGPALRDAREAATRAARDEAAAARRREALQAAPLPAIAPDERIGSQLGEGELVHDLRERAILRAPGDDRALGYGGSLYLTSRRLVHLGQVVVTMHLTDIVETSLAGERMLLTLREGEGVAIDLDAPREFRVGLSWAIREARS